ncbi:alpha-galactosidase [Exiguobacterium sp. s78]|uniref:alpha-galactosidase n=1 Tax=Exiguobacterium sp. s78 TaxID=2751197 RepID=UPI001BEAF739|nr:alpha-galactosidase [Exiguobacterium sp. s78]
MAIFEVAGRRFVIEGKRVAHVVTIGANGKLIHTYFGAKLPYRDDYEALPSPIVAHSSFESPDGVATYDFVPFGEMLYTEPTLKSEREDGQRIHQFQFERSEQTETKLTLWLFDPLQEMRVGVQYEVFADYDIIGRSIVVENTGRLPVRLTAAQSFAMGRWHQPNLKLHHFAGMWTGEFKKQITPVTPGRQTIESRRGVTSHQANPWFALEQDATEDRGEVIYGHFAYSGNWAIHVEQDAFGFVQLSGGMNPFDFSWKLSHQQQLTTPTFYIGYANGFADMSAHAHAFQRNVIMPRATERPVLYNSWEATYFDVTESGQRELVDLAAGIGCELFVVDDGWFGERNSDQAGLGDWHVNREKFPNGLEPLISYVKQQGLQFGLWVEPEMVNPDSDLYRSHPDWIYHARDAVRTTSRNQYVLNLGLPEVEQFILEMMDDLLTRHAIDYIKWDMNRAFSEPGVPKDQTDRQQELWKRHVDALYRIFDELRRLHPTVDFEACAGGGGRIDLGILSRTEQVWTSDNTDPLDRLQIQHDFSYAYNAKMMSCWVTDGPNWLNGRNVPLATRFVSSMQGTLGIGGNLSEWSTDELAEAKGWIETYQAIRPTVQRGIQYRLSAFTQQTPSVMQYTSEEETVLLAIAPLRQYGAHQYHFKLKRLDPAMRYQVEDRTLSGAYLMQQGLTFSYTTDYEARCLRIQPVHRALSLLESKETIV